MSTWRNDPEALERVKMTFFDPFRDRLCIQGVDSMTRCREADGTKIDRIAFPDRFSATSRETDIGILQHEMGHFLTVSEHRSIAPSFPHSVSG